MEQLRFFDEKTKSTDWKWTFADYPKEKNGLKVFSCFACGGGSTMGYKLSGCDVIGCCEIDPKMNEVYVKNHKPKYNFLMDIRDFNKIPNEELSPELLNLDILDGSPPCTTFSMAGDREKSWGKKKKFREGQKEQTLDNLFFVFIETAKKLMPKVVIAENVEGLLLGNAWEYIQRIYKDFDAAGYDLKHYLCKGEKMGIPQTRHRAFFIAVRKDFEFDFEKLDMTFNYAPITYGKIKEGEGEKLKSNSKNYELLCKARQGDKKMSNILARENKKIQGFSDRICWEKDVLPTLTACGGIFRGTEKTKLSNEDIISATTFPRDFNFINKNIENVQYICGMSVPPIMIKRIVGRLIDTGIFEAEAKR